MPNIRLLNLTIWLSREGIRPIYFEGEKQKLKHFYVHAIKDSKYILLLFFFRYFEFLLIFAPLLISIVFCMSCLMSVWMCALYYLLMLYGLPSAHAHILAVLFRVPIGCWQNVPTLWQSVKLPPSRLCSDKFWFFFRPALHVFWASHSLYIPYTRLGSMEQEDDETGTKNSNVAVDPESCVTVALPEVRLGMSIITQRLFFCWQNFSTYLFGYGDKAYVDKVGV